MQDREAAEAARGDEAIDLHLELHGLGVHERKGRESVAKRDRGGTGLVGCTCALHEARGRGRQLDPDWDIHSLFHRFQNAADHVFVIGDVGAHILAVHVRARQVQLNGVATYVHDGPGELLPVRHLIIPVGARHDRGDEHAGGVGGLDLFQVRQPQVERLVRNQLPIPRGVRDGIGALIARHVRRHIAGALKDRLGACYVFNVMQTDCFSDNAAPTGLKRAQDLALALGRRCGGQHERIFKLKARKSRRKSVHDSASQ